VTWAYPTVFVESIRPAITTRLPLEIASVLPLQENRQIPKYDFWIVWRIFVLELSAIGIVINAPFANLDRLTIQK